MIDDGRIDDAFADGAGHMQAKHRESDKVEERRPQHGPLGRQHTRGNDGGDGVGGVMKAVHKIEHQRHHDQKYQNFKGHA